MELDEVLQGYVVCSSPCGGSEVLGRLLRKTKQVGFPHYFFHHNMHTESLHKKWSVIDNNGDINYVRYFQRLQENRTTKNGVFGMLTYTKQLIEHHRLMSTLPKAKLIVVRRKDWAAQAVDGVEMAEQLRTNEKEVEFLYGKLIDCFSHLMQEEILLRQVYQNKENQLEIFYEELCARPLEILETVTDFLGISQKISKDSRTLRAYQKFIPQIKPEKRKIYDRFRNILEKKKIL